MSLHVLPPPLMIDGGIALSYEIRDGVVDGAIGECVVCHRTCWTWWSPAPPQGYVALHRERCPARLRDLWAEAVRDGVAAETSVMPIARGAGAYGRRRAAASTSERATVMLSVRRGIELPEGFTPGPFWKPGYSHLEPWAVHFQSGAGGGFAPFGRHEGEARQHLRRLRLQRVVDHNVPVVGAVLLAPDGTRVDEWGEAPVYGLARWEGVARLSEWSRCASCGQPRWPGSWQTVGTGRCRACQEADELADPRPWPEDPKDPGLATAPDFLGGPKKRKGRSSKKDAGLS